MHDLSKTLLALGAVGATLLVPAFAQANWTALSPVNTRSAFGMTTDSAGHIHVFGGQAGATFSYTNSHQEYDPASDTWTPRAALPIAGSLPACVATAADGRIFYIGGRTTGGNATVATTRIYDPGTDTWSTGTDMPTATRSAACDTDAAGNFIIFGGNTAAGTLATDAVLAYDPVNDQWSTRAAMPLGRSIANVARRGWPLLSHRRVRRLERDDRRRPDLQPGQ